MSRDILSKVNKNGDAYTYNSVPIPLEETLTEKIYDSDTGKVEEYKYAKIDGTKYYLDYNRQVFYMQNGEKNYSPSNTPEILNDYINKIEHNSSAYNFYKDAYAFTEKIKGSNLIGLSFRDSRDQNGNTISETGFIGEDKIFGGIVSAEDKSSNFSEHRVAVIRYSIEKNLTTAIANYDEKFGGDLAFSMPTLSEQDWYNLTNKTSVITFLQGFPMGTRLYNSYVVVTNNKNRDAITQDSIYIATSDGQYHSIYEKDLNNLTGLTGYLNVDFERRTLDGTHYYYPREETGAYTSIVNQTETVEVEDIDTYMQDNSSLAQAYYTALGRERYSMYRGAN